MRLAYALIAAGVLFGFHPAMASVVLTGTRIIYPAGVSSQTVQLSSKDAHPWLVQAWLDAGDEDSTPDTLDETVPFILSPPIFRMEPNSGQALRLLLADADHLPTDRESLFYFNFTQIPALQSGQLDANRLMVIIRSRVKLFYRPRGLGTPNWRKLACMLQIKLDGDQVEISNPAPFHVVVSQAELRMHDHSVALLSGHTLAPFSQQRWTLETPPAHTDQAQLQVSVVNDYGVDEPYTCPWE